MNGPLSTDGLASRFNPYVKELREFFSTRGMSFGSPGDVVRLTAKVTSPGSAHEEMTAIVRSIIFREHEAIPRTVLLDIIVTAAAGSAVQEAPREVQEAIHQLHAYVGEVINSLRRRSFIEDPEDAEAETESLESASEPPSDKELEAETVSEQADEEPILLAQPTAFGSSNHATVIDKPEPFVVPVDLQTNQHAELVPTPGSVPVSSRKMPTPHPSHWLAVLCALMIALLAGILWVHRSTQNGSQVPNGNQPGVVSQPPPIQAALPTVTGSANTDDHLREAATTTRRPLATTPNIASVPSRVQPPVPAVELTRAQVNAAAPSVAPAKPQASSKFARNPSRPLPASAATGQPTSAQNKPGQQGSFLVSSGVMSGNLITSPTTPKYPKMANMAGIQGQVIMQAVVSRNGTVVATHVLDGHRLLRSAATRAVRSWRYRPYLVKGKPADVATIVIVDFHLQN